MQQTQNIADAIESLSLEVEQLIEQELAGESKFLVMSLKFASIDDGMADIKILAETANTKDEMKNIIIGWGYDLETVTSDQVQIYDLNQIRQLNEK